MFGYEAYEVWAELRRLLAELRHRNTVATAGSAVDVRTA